MIQFFLNMLHLSILVHVHVSTYGLITVKHEIAVSHN